MNDGGFYEHSGGGLIDDLSLTLLIVFTAVIVKNVIRKMFHIHHLKESNIFSVNFE